MRWVALLVVLGGGCSAPQQSVGARKRGGADAAVFLATQDSFYARLRVGNSSRCLQVSVGEDRLSTEVDVENRVARVSWRYKVVPSGFIIFGMSSVVFRGERGRGVSRSCEREIQVRGAEADGLRTARGRIYDGVEACRRDPKVFDLGACSLPR